MCMQYLAIIYEHNKHILIIIMSYPFASDNIDGHFNISEAIESTATVLALLPVKCTKSLTDASGCIVRYKTNTAKSSC